MFSEAASPQFQPHSGRHLDDYGWALSRSTRNAQSLQRRKSTHPGDDCVQIGFSQSAVVDLSCHQRFEWASVPSDPMGERPLDLRVGPRADAGGLMRRDVADNDAAERACHFISALSKPVLIIVSPVWPASMTLHA